MPYRFPWDDCCSTVQANDGLGTVKIHPEYQDAKSGDAQAAWELVRRILRKPFLDWVEQRMREVKNPCLLPVLAMEEQGANKIPAMAAAALSAVTGCPVETRVYQATKAFRTGSGADHRLVVQPEYAGEVNPDADYLLIDDTFTMGGTLANLRGHCQKQGARVCALLALSAHPAGLQIAPKREWVHTIQRKFPGIDNFWQESFGYDSTCITQGEAGHIRKAGSLDELRSRFALARDAYFDRLGSVRISEVRQRRVVPERESGRELSFLVEENYDAPFTCWGQLLQQANPHSRMFRYAAFLLDKIDREENLCLRDIENAGSVLLHPVFRQAAWDACLGEEQWLVLLESMASVIDQKLPEASKIFSGIIEKTKIAFLHDEDFLENSL